MVPRTLLCVGDVSTIADGLMPAMIQPGVAAPIAFQTIAWACASGSFFLSLLASVWTFRSRRVAGNPGTGRHATDVGLFAALFLGAVAFAIELATLLVRSIYAMTEVVNVYPSRVDLDLGFGDGGLWTLCALAASCVVGGLLRRNRRLLIALLWLGVTAALWSCLASPVYQISPSGALERTTGTAWLALELGAMVACFPLVARLVDHKRLGRLGEFDPFASFDWGGKWPGLRSSCSVMAAFVILLTTYHLAVPIASPGMSVRSTVFVLLAGCSLSAAGAFLLIVGQWQARLADVAMWLLSIILAMLPVLFVPAGPTLMAEHYPLVLNSLLIGFAISTGSCAWLALALERRVATHDDWPTARRLIPHAKRFIFVNAMMALIMGGMMALWPQLGLIAAPDLSHGRVTWGFGGNLFLLLVLLWCSRRMGRFTYHVLTMLALVSTIGFMVVRMLPFTPRFD